MHDEGSPHQTQNRIQLRGLRQRGGLVDVVLGRCAGLSKVHLVTKGRILVLHHGKAPRQGLVLGRESTNAPL